MPSEFALAGEASRWNRLLDRWIRIQEVQVPFVGFGPGAVGTLNLDLQASGKKSESSWFIVTNAWGVSPVVHLVVEPSFPAPARLSLPHPPDLVPVATQPTVQTW